MAYQNIPVTDGYQVTQQIADFAASVGWTVHRANEENDIDGSTSYFEVTLSANGYPCYVTLAGYGNAIRMNGHRGYDSGKRWWDQPDQYLNFDDDANWADTQERETTAVCELRVNPILSVHLFGGMSPTPYLYAAIEKEPGYYRHLTVGHLQKFGTAAGGMFWDVSNRHKDNRGYSSFPEYHRGPLLNDRKSDDYNDGVGGFDVQQTDGSPNFNRFGAVNYASYGEGGHNGGELNSFMVAGPITFNGRTPLQAPVVFANIYTPFGTATAMRYINLEFFEAGDELTIGGETWKVFPWARRGNGVRNLDIEYSAPEYEASGNYGVAYLKD